MKGRKVFLVMVVLILLFFSCSVSKGEWDNKLIESAKNGDLEGAKTAILKGADVNAKLNNRLTPLHCASTAEVAKLLVEKGADVNAKDDYGWTPLHNAAYNGHLEVVKLLIQKGAVVNAKNIDGKTPLKLAIEEGKADVANYLESVGGKE